MYIYIFIFFVIGNKSSSSSSNIQYDIYNSTKEVLKDFHSGQEDKLQHRLICQGSFFSNVAKFSNSLSQLNTLWSAAQYIHTYTHTYTHTHTHMHISINMYCKTLEKDCIAKFRSDLHHHHRYRKD